MIRNYNSNRIKKPAALLARGECKVNDKSEIKDTLSAKVSVKRAAKKR